MPENTRKQRISGGGGRRKPRSPRRKALLITAWVLAAAVLLGGGALGFLYFKLNGNLTSVDIDAKLGKDRPDDVDNGSLDILVLGSDSRSGANRAYGHSHGARSDTAMIVHVYEDRKKASVVSIPRDTLIDRPACRKDDGATAPAARDVMFNSAYAVGGPACSVKTVEKLTGIRMDHFVEVDFTGFKHLIDQLGGVKITTKKAIHDKDSHLDLPAGSHRLNGEQSLGLVRTRHAVGDGSDLGRIQLQQTFMKALIEQVKGIGLFSSPAKLYRLADTATSSITTDKQLASVSRLTKLSRSLQSIGADDTRMVTMPVTYDPSDPNRVLPLADQSQQVWAALKADRPIPAAALKDSAGRPDDKNGVAAVPSAAAAAR